MATKTDPPSVLIVEDDPALAGYLVAALSGKGYPTFSAGNRAGARHALSVLNPPELMLLDLGLPPQPSTMTEGLAVLNECRQIAPATKIIVLTGQDEQAAAREAVRGGAFDFLVKPAALATILQSLQRAELFVREEKRMAASGETRLNITARLGEGPKSAGAAAEEQLLRQTLVETRYNVAETARRLGLAREHVYYYLNKYGIQRPE